MHAINLNNRMPFDAFQPVPPVNRLAERVRNYVDQHPELDRAEFLLNAVQREIDFREQREMENDAWPARGEHDGTDRWRTARPPRSAAEIRRHAWLIERPARLHH